MKDAQRTLITTLESVNGRFGEFSKLTNVFVFTDGISFVFGDRIDNFEKDRFLNERSFPSFSFAFKIHNSFHLNL